MVLPNNSYMFTFLCETKQNTTTHHNPVVALKISKLHVSYCPLCLHWKLTIFKSLVKNFLSFVRELYLKFHSKDIIGCFFTSQIHTTSKNFCLHKAANRSRFAGTVPVRGFLNCVPASFKMFPRQRIRNSRYAIF